MSTSVSMFLGDVRTLSPDFAFDVMIIDPPYRKHVHRKAVSQSAGGGVRERDLGFDHLSAELRRLVASFAARARRWSVIYSDVESLAWWRISLEAAKAQYIRTIPWVRWSMPQLSGDRPPTGFEPLTIAWGSNKGPKSWNGPGNLTHLDHCALRGEDKHKTEKPLDQALDLVTWFSNPGELVFDGLAGRGTTGLACRLLGRSFVGIELDPEEHAKADERLRSPLSERDNERWLRWVESQVLAIDDKERRAKINANARAKAKAKAT